MSGITSTSGYAGNQWQWFQPASTGTTSSAAPAVDADGDGDNSPMVSALTGSSSGTSGTNSTANASPLALLSNDLQSLLTSLQDVSASGASTGLGSSGTVSPDGGPVSQFFASVDTNGDGSISPSELKKALGHGGGHGHHHAEAASGSSTSNLTNDVNTLLQSLQQVGSTTTAGDTSATAGDTSATSGNTALNDQFSKMLADLSSYLQSEGKSTVQVSA